MSEIELDDLKKTVAEITNNIGQKPNNIQQLQQPILKNQPKDIRSGSKDNKKVNFIENNMPDNNIKNDKSDFFALGYLNIPKQTLYFTIILIIISSMMYYYNTKQKTNKKHEE